MKVVYNILYNIFVLSCGNNIIIVLLNSTMQYNGNNTILQYIVIQSIVAHPRLERVKMR